MACRLASSHCVPMLCGLLILVLCENLLSPLSAAEEQPLGVVVELDVPVPMRDGTILRADVWRPDRGGPYPVLVWRTPYGKQGKKFNRHVEAGYIVVCQDARGRYASDGQFESFVRSKTHDGVDGYDTVEWAARLPNSTGKVATFGSSYPAFLQWRLAPLRPPSLVAMSAQTIPARHSDLEGPGAIRPGRRLWWWTATMAPDLRRRAGRPGTHTRDEAKLLWDAGESRNLITFLPWMELPDRVFEDEAEAVRQWLADPHTDPWRLDEQVQEIEVPNFDIVGWFDHCNGDMLLYRTMAQEARSETARKQSRIIIGPWSHSARGKRRFGDLDFGPEASLDLTELDIRWFDYWLKGDQNGVDQDAPVRIFVMGANRWRDEREWPLSRQQPRELYLASGGRANTPAGDGRLNSEPPPTAGLDRYRYDPRDPVPSLYGAELFTMPTDQRPLASRADILVYQSEPLDEPLEVTGNPVVELFAATSAPDTDFFARLIDVAPDGTAREVTMGMVRARYRKSPFEPELIEPGQVVRYTIRMNPTSNEFQPGHRIRIDVTSSDFPNYDRNHNTAANQNADATLVSADQTIHHGGARPSKVILPVIPPECP